MDEIGRIAKITKSIIKEKKVKLFSQYDADGLSSASIISKMLLRENVYFETRILKQLTVEAVADLKFTENDFIIFTDFGSGQLNLLKDILDKTHILVLDHHQPVEFDHMNLLHINPLNFGDEELSSSIICYLFAKNVNIKNTDLIELAITGAIGDIQDENWEFKGFLRKILEEAETLGKLSIMRGLRLYGRNSRPIYKSLAFSYDPFIPGITGSESQAIQFLSDLGIKLKENDDWKKLKDLTLEEQQKLASAIIMERLKDKNVDPENVFGEIYTLLGKPEEIQDTREFATLLNACGRTNNTSVALRLCLGDFTVLDNSFDVLNKYRKMIGDSIDLVRENNIVRTTDNASFILAGSKIPESVIGTVTSILMNSSIIDNKKPIFGLAETDNGGVKISARMPRGTSVNLRDVIFNAVKVIGGEAGGHKDAAGAYIQKGKEEEFIRLVDSLLGEAIGSQKS